MPVHGFPSFPDARPPEVLERQWPHLPAHGHGDGHITSSQPIKIMQQLCYIAKSKIPSRHANSVQVVNMICAFASLVTKVEAYLPGGFSRRLRLWSGTLFSSYGHQLPYNVRISLLSSLKYDFERRVLQVFTPKPKSTVFTRSATIAYSLAERDIPVLFESHSFAKDEKAFPMHRFIKAVNNSKAAGIIGISHEILDNYISKGLCPSRILTSPDGVNLDIFQQPGAGRLGQLFGQKIYERPSLVYTGSLSEEKGAGFLARAAVRMPQFNIVVIGGNARESTSLANAGKKASNLFIHPCVPHKDIPAILQDATILVMPYMPEGSLIPYMSPLKLFEYLATGRPILSADLPVLHPFLKNGANCLLFTPGSVDSLYAKAIQMLTMNSEEKKALRDGQLHTATCYSWTKRATAILNWHRALMHSKEIL
jgi:glycosyltransferase involved in cell wall biosynthesis